LQGLQNVAQKFITKIESEAAIYLFKPVTFHAEIG